MKQIKRCITIFLLSLILLDVSTADTAATISSSAVEVLQTLGIITAAEFLNSGTITRRQGLKIAATIKCHGWYPIYSSQSQIDFLHTYYTDIEDNTDDCNLVVMCTIQELLKGTYDDEGNLVANLDAALTYQEALTILDRVLFIENEEFVIAASGEYWWFDYAEKRGLINITYNTPVYYNISQIPPITLSNQYDAIPSDVFLELAYRTLYIPRIINTYGGPLQQYHIEEFILGMDK